VTQGKFRPVLFVVIIWMHAMACLALWYEWNFGFTLSALLWLIGVHTLRSVGISLGNHRLFTHRSFKCHFPTEVLLDFCGAMAAQGSLLKWVLDHDQHHKDTEGLWDPHTPAKFGGVAGFLWAHCVWLFYDVKRPSKDFALISARKNVRIAKWDKWVYPIGLLSGFVIPFYFEGFAGLLLVGFLGVVISWHITWCVNSVCHLFGGADPAFQKTRDQSRNNWPLSLLSYIGEAWHNYHHQKADSAFLGWRWYQPDLGKWILIVGEKAGLFWDINRPPTEAKQKQLVFE